jgi:hypothetical protein
MPAVPRYADGAEFRWCGAGRFFLEIIDEFMKLSSALQPAKTAPRRNVPCHRTSSELDRRRGLLVHTRNPLRILLLVPTIAIALTSCKPAEQSAAAQPRPVRVVTVARQEGGETVSLSGQIEAETEVSLSFRVGGG